MKIGLLSDIHGNVEALSRVIEDATNQKVEKFAFLGDLTFLGLYPKECYEILMSLSPIVYIKGNTDANIEELDSFIPTNSFEQYLHDVIKFTHDSLDERSRNEISSWPIAQQLCIEERNVIFCHGSPYSFNDKLLSNGETTNSIAEKLQLENVELIFSGHTHTRGDFFIGNKRIINPGSIGYRFDGGIGASYTIIEITKEGVEVDNRIIPYNQEHYIDELLKKSTELPLLKSVIYALTTGQPMPNFKEYFTTG